MKAFIDYFWKNIGDSQSRYGTGLFSVYHISMLAMLFFLLLILNKLSKKHHTVKSKEKFLRTLGIVLACLEMIRIIHYMTIEGYTLIGSISFHLCAIGVYLVIALVIFKKQWLFDAVFVHALLGAPFALIIPYGILPFFPVFSFMPVQSFISHFLLIYIVYYALKEKLYHVKKQNYHIVVMSVLVSVLVAYLMSVYNYHHGNAISDNYIWTRYLEDYFGFFKEIPHPYYIVLFLSAFLGLGYFVYSRLEQENEDLIIEHEEVKAIH